MGKENFDFNAKYFVPMFPRGKSGINDTKYMVECNLLPYEFGVFSYKLYAVPINADSFGFHFSKREYYTNDFCSGVKEGYIVKKNNPEMYYTLETGYEALTNNVYLVHTIGVFKGVK